MNWLNVSHQTTTAVYFVMSIPGGTAPVKKVERLAINQRALEKTDVIVIGAGAAGMTAATDYGNYRNYRNRLEASTRRRDG